MVAVQETNAPVTSALASRPAAGTSGPKRRDRGIEGQPTQLRTEMRVAVGTALTGGPPHRSVREALPHTALTSGQ
jgi:hypothetical protein